MANPLARDNPFSIIAAPVVWSAYFLVVYVANAIACAKGLTDARIAGINAVDLIVAASTAVTLGLLLALAWVSWVRFKPLMDARDNIHEHDRELSIKGRRRFMALAGLLQAALAILATVYVGLPVLLVPKC
jgi:hypothetical protein